MWEKVEQDFAKINFCHNWKRNLPKALKLLPLAVIPHKSCKYQAILDLSFTLRLAGYKLPLVNKVTERCAPEEAIDQIGSILPQII